jgi:hypothetical protein
LIEALTKDGILLYETFMVGNEAYGRPSNPDFLLKPNELLDAFTPRLFPLSFEQGIEDRGGQKRVVQRIAAVNSDAPTSLPSR